ncbi:DUF296 domain-containing protein [Methanoculleus chikugoensis]|uniref:PCC domain-containing protein n=1 Tax=Methanoculleus chikugoensis TaxID=118126 RepID=UPI000A8FC744|nr:DUF296 domain-containing protein [Methanoculleus chikugoensis]
MQYSEGQVGRVFTVRIDDGEDFLREIQRFVAAMNIRCGTIQFLGAVRSATIVTGAERAGHPAVPPAGRRDIRRLGTPRVRDHLPPRGGRAVHPPSYGGGEGIRRSPGASGRRRRSTW